MKLLAASIFVCAVGVVIGSDIQLVFKSSEVVPDLLTTAPNELLKVTYDGKSVDFGAELKPKEVKAAPTLSWAVDPSAYYTICMADPDAPSRAEPSARAFLHWLVANVPGTELNQGEVLAAYVGSGPPAGTGLHRYVLLAYRQQGKLDLKAEPRIPNNSDSGRLSFSISTFAGKYGLGEPVAGNMFRAQYDG